MLRIVLEVATHHFTHKYRIPVGRRGEINANFCENEMPY